MKVLLLTSILAIVAIIYAVARGIKDEMDILLLEDRLDELNRELKDERCRTALEKQKRENEEKEFEELLRKIIEVCEDKKYKGVLVLRGTIKKLVADNYDRTRNK